MREPFDRPGGLHSYVRGLAGGQSEIGLNPVVVDRITARAQFGLAMGDLTDGEAVGRESVVEYHFAHGAFPFLFGRNNPWRGTPSLFHFHGPWYQEGLVQGNGRARAVVKRLLESFVYSKFTQFVVASDYFGRVLSREFGVPGENIRTVYPGVDGGRFEFAANTEQARRSLGIPEDAFVATTVRRLEPRMGIEDAIVAVQSHPDMFLTVAGTGSLKNSLLGLVRDLGIENRVKFLGRVSDAELPLVYQSADVSLVPTRDLEGFGMVVLESMACGTPVISTNVGGLPEAMGPFAREWAVQPHSIGELSERLSQMSSLSRLREKARQYADSRSNVAMANAVESLIRETI